MASTSKTDDERALSEDLQHAVHGLHAPFTCDGTLVPEQPVHPLLPGVDPNPRAAREGHFRTAATSPSAGPALLGGGVRLRA
jgi:hypothetical protein